MLIYVGFIENKFRVYLYRISVSSPFLDHVFLIVKFGFLFLNSPNCWGIYDLVQ